MTDYDPRLKLLLLRVQDDTAHAYRLVARATEQATAIRHGIAGDLREMRNRLGLTQGDVAGQVGCSASTLSGIERGDSWSEPVAFQLIQFYRDRIQPSDTAGPDAEGRDG